jgi:hypothetical protein
MSVNIDNIGPCAWTAAGICSGGKMSLYWIFGVGAETHNGIKKGIQIVKKYSLSTFFGFLGMEAILLLPPSEHPCSWAKHIGILH